MNIGVIRREFGSYEQKRFISEIGKKNIVKIFPKDICMFLDSKLSVFEKGKKLNADVYIPRFGDKCFNFGLLLTKHLENMGVPLVNNYDSIVACKNKYLSSLALKKKKIPQPRAAVALSEKDIMKHVKHMKKPVVLKLLSGSYGHGVARINDDVEAGDWIETIRYFSEPIYIQEYVNHPGEDYRIFVVGDKVVAGMKRTACTGWKANFSLGGKVENYKPSKEMKEIALRCKDAIGADVIGVDIMINDYPEVIEVNSFPGFKGIEKATGRNVCREIVKFAKQKAKR